MATGESRTIDDRFVIQNQIGTGRMSSVHVAIDTSSNNNTVAVKILNTQHPDAVKRELFRRETGALKRLRHPNIVRLHHSGWSASERAFYLVLDYFPYSLDRYLAGHDRSELRVHPYGIMRELGAALAHAHSENVIHRDIKPSNILFTAEGRPMLTDFGISKLFTHLTVGETLAGFWSGGYASPEQRAGKSASTQSDVYSLGAVFFYILSRTEPPPEGPTPTMVDGCVRHPSPIKTVLKSMLDTNPEARPPRGADLLSLLDVTRRHEKLPEHLLILTHSAIRDLRAAGHYRGDRFQNAADALVEDLGGKEADEVHVNREQQDDRGLVVLGDTLRLICTRNQDDDALVVKAVQTPYGPYLDREKVRSMLYRAMWRPVDAEGTDGRPPAGAGRGLRDLWMTVRDYERLEVDSKERRRSRQEFIERWDIALRNTRTRIEKGAPALQYAGVVEESDYVRFLLTESPPDDLGWEDDMRLAVKESAEAPTMPVGNLMGIRGKVVRVAKETRLTMESRRGDSAIPRHGLLTVNVAEALTAYTRQQHAVHAFLNGEMVNQNVAKCIVDPAAATRMTEPKLEYHQEWLSDDKKSAVRMALSCGELCLIKGPPGTGKTSVIAEVVLQILKHEPEARILLTSQSNVAVDHALVQIARASPGEPPAMVRYGRPEKIGDAGKNWTLGQRVRSWRNDVVKKCDAVVEELRERERNARASVKELKEVDIEESENAEMMQEWVAEAKSLAEQLADYRQELGGLGKEASGETKATLEAAVAGTRDELRGQLTALSELLREEDGPDLLADGPEEEALATIVKKVAEATSADVNPASPEERELHRIRELRTTITQWRQVAGLGSDFEELVAKSARVVAATCSMSGKRKARTADNSFDWAIVDEAGRATVPEVLIPMVQSERSILVGDERQLPPMLDETLRESGSASGDEGLDRSLFQSMVGQMEEGKGLATLRTQYRMHPAIGSLISTVFYDGTLENGDLPEARGRVGDWMPAIVTWLSTSALPNRGEVRRGVSYENVAEADVVARFLSRLESSVESPQQAVVVGVIAGYSAQVERLVTRIDPDNGEIWRGLRIEVATVDAFQGRECDVVIYSTVRSNKDRRIGFLRDYRRVNVALSRARQLLVIVGDNRMMESARVVGSDNPFAAVLSYMKSARDDCAVVPAGVVRQ